VPGKPLQIFKVRAMNPLWVKFYIVSRDDIEQYNIWQKSHIIVSIRSPGIPKAVVKRTDATKQIVFLEFDDLDERVGPSFARVYGREPRLFNKDDANLIIEAVKTHVPRVVICQCEAGISRSSAVALGLDEWINNKPRATIARSRFIGDSMHITTTRPAVPNFQVYKTIRDVTLGPPAEQSAEVFREWLLDHSK